jgi:metal-responsive CopG/Arc/MetJ family transcriptional regulator
VSVCFKVDEDLLRELEELARLRGIYRSEAIRRAIAWYVWSQTGPSVTPRMTVYVAGNGGNAGAGTPRIRVR